MGLSSEEKTLVIQVLILLASARIPQITSNSVTTSPQVYSSGYGIRQNASDVSSPSQLNDFNNSAGNLNNSVTHPTHEYSSYGDITSVQSDSTGKENGKINGFNNPKRRRPELNHYNASDLDNMERKVNQSISVYIKNSSKTHLADIALKTTAEYVTLLNSSLQTLLNICNESSDDSEENTCLTLKHLYEIKLEHMSKHLLILRNLQKLIGQYYSVKDIMMIQRNLTEKYNNLSDFSYLKESCEVTKNIMNILESQINQAHVINNLTGPGKMDKLFSITLTESLRKVVSWETSLSKYRKYLSNCEQEVQQVQQVEFRYRIKYYVLPVIQGILFVVGFVGNIILLVIFFRTRDFRAGPNVMVLNLAIADCLHLLINIPIFYVYFVSSRWEAGVELCTIFRFFKTLCKFVSVYAVVVISLQKFVALSNVFLGYVNCCHVSKRLKELLYISSVWIIGLLLSLPHSMKVGLYDGNCYDSDLNDIDFSKWISLFDLLMLCIVPGTVIMVSSVINSIRLKKSIQTIPGESVGHDKVKHAREVSSKILIALTVVFLISYTPFSIYATATSWLGEIVEDRVHLTLSIVFYHLMFFNSCFNPIALYIVSRKYRTYFKRHILCRHQSQNPSEYNSRSTKLFSTNV